MNGFSVFLRRRWPLVLAGSLLLNAFLVGAFVVDWLKPHRGFSGERFARFELRRLDDRLPKAAADQVAAALEPLAAQVDERLTRVREIRSEIMRLAAVPTPDRAALDAKLAELRVESAAMQESVQTATYDALLALPPEDRARLAEEPTR
jgi:uncharacterized membrane protein